MEIVLVGLNHRTAPVEVRERVSFTAEQAQRASEELRAKGILEETLVLSTCNRSEVYGVPPEAVRESAGVLSDFLSAFHSVQNDVLRVSLYHHYDREAVRHLFRVASGLDSMLLGEAEILGQVREAYRLAHEARATGPVLNRLFQGALEVGKRVRSETELGTRPMSVASAGVKLAERVFGKLKERSALVLGAGTISEQVVSQLRDRNIAHLHMMNRSRERAESLANEFGGQVIPWGEWDAALAVPDLVVSSVSAEQSVLTRAILEQAMIARGNRTLFVMDLGLPRNVEGAAAQLYNLYLYNLDDLTEIVQQNRNARESEIPKAESLVDEHVAKFLSWQASVELVDVLAELRTRLKEEREAFVRTRLDGMSHLSLEERSKMEALMDGLLEKLLLEPAERLRSEKELRRKIQNVEALRELFLPDKDKS
ncbi:MAG TPA: glutamyl-tRNA reductase [Candidatus Acidoferrum sp.]|nr:glutamyl-tRNA reductase [Candidatus Acidoferrum sp.]